MKPSQFAQRASVQTPRDAGGLFSCLCNSAQRSLRLSKAALWEQPIVVVERQSRSGNVKKAQAE